MKVYVEEKDMPKDCASCKYYVLNCSDSYSCIKQNGKAIHPNFNDGMGYRHEDCPFHSLADYTKQVRKEVCDQLCNMLADRAELIDFGYNVSEFMFSVDDLQECSKVILGEDNEPR